MGRCGNFRPRPAKKNSVGDGPKRSSCRSSDGRSTRRGFRFGRLCSLDAGSVVPGKYSAATDGPLTKTVCAAIDAAIAGHVDAIRHRPDFKRSMDCRRGSSFQGIPNCLADVETGAHGDVRTDAGQ